MTNEHKQELIKRLKALAWHTGMMVLAVVVNWTAANLKLFDLPMQLTVILGLILGQISKYLNSPK